VAADADGVARRGLGELLAVPGRRRAPVGYLETADYQAALDAMAATEVNQRWQAEMSQFFVNDGPPDRSLERLAEVFHLD
jgi:L-rhamnose mutarotase